MVYWLLSTSNQDGTPRPLEGVHRHISVAVIPLWHHWKREGWHPIQGWQQMKQFSHFQRDQKASFTIDTAPRGRAGWSHLPAAISRPLFHWKTGYCRLPNHRHHLKISHTDKYFLIFTTVLSRWDFSNGKFGLPSPGESQLQQSCATTTYCACWVF